MSRHKCRFLRGAIRNHHPVLTSHCLFQHSPFWSSWYVSPCESVLFFFFFPLLKMFKKLLLRCNSYKKLHHSKGRNSMAFFFFVFLMLYTTVRVPDISITPTRTTVSGSSHSLLPHTLAISNLPFVSVDSSILNISYKRNYICSISCLASFH